MKYLKSFNTKNTKQIMFLMALFFTIHLNAADEFAEAAEAIGSASEGGKTILGAIMSWGFSVVLPLIAMIVGVALGYKFQSKKAEQDQSTFKLFVILAGCAIAGFFVYAVIVMLISRALYGDFNELANKIYDFWRSVKW
ncbi:hypothetical protein ABZL51_001629 [Campylobacter jejuni]|nr:hypothetical protein [Campylobacter jejuni]ECO2639776.1 hypothetical protein [Campylobacter jejuni]HEC1903774.1 hypothetical protein [Campylobacter jejuni]HEC1932206.1 hypothetical protein [Campylobacter jejuni]